MALSDLTSPTAIKLAIEECDRLGRESFLHQYSFGFAREYVLRYGGKEYDSKGIGCVAHAYQNPELGVLRKVAGGKDAVGKRVFDLGFDVDGLKRQPTDWTLEECETAAEAYFQCLAKKLRGETYNREAACRDVAAQIGRSKGAVDYKFQNIDAILLENSLPRMMNAVAPNVQRLLRYVVLDPLATSRTTVFGTVAEHVPVVSDAKTVFVPVPEIVAPAREPGQEATRPSAGTKIDFAERDARNRKLGRNGEQWVVELERRTLIGKQRADLADRVHWVAEYIGDGLGYDIASFDEQGQEKFIEVKTTNAGPATPFYISPNELAVADQRGAAYRLYRVFDFGGEPKVFVIEGPLSGKLQLEIRMYSALPGARPST
jgi:Domain of unknown function (DUF3883)